MGKTYRNDSDNNRKRFRQEKKRKSRNKKQGCNQYNPDNPNESDLRLDDYFAKDGIYFEKFSKRGKKR